MVISDSEASQCAHSISRFISLPLPDAINSISPTEYNGDVYGHVQGLVMQLLLNQLLLRHSTLRPYNETSLKATTGTDHQPQ